MKKQTIKEIKKRIDYVWKNPSPKVKSERVTQLYIYLMSVYDEVKSDPRYFTTTTKKAVEFLHDSNASQSCKKTMQEWLEYSTQPAKFTFNVEEASLTIHDDPDWGELIILPIATGCESSLITLCQYRDFDVDVTNERYQDIWFKHAREHNLIIE